MSKIWRLNGKEGSTDSVSGLPSHSACAFYSADQEAVPPDGEAAFDLGARQILTLHGAASDRSPIIVCIGLAALHRLTCDQRLQVAGAGIGVAGSAFATWAAMAWQLGRINR